MSTLDRHVASTMAHLWRRLVRDRHLAVCRRRLQRDV